MSKKQTFEEAACILGFTDKAKVLVRKLLKEELMSVRMKGKNGSEIIITFDHMLEIVTIDKESEEDEDSD